MSAVRTIADALATPEFVTTLRDLLNAIDEHQLPTSGSISSGPSGGTTVYLAPADLPAWLIAFDLAAPDWQYVVHDDDRVSRGAYYHASAAGLPFSVYVTEWDPVPPPVDLSDVGRPLVASDYASDELWRAARERGHVADGRTIAHMVVDAESFAHFCDATGGVTR